MSKPITVAIVGLGNRGMYAYGSKILERPDQIKVVAAADTDRERLELMAKDHGIAPEYCFNSADELIAQPKLADLLFICTQDKDHYTEAIEALKKGYHLILEKPISPSLKECKEIAETAKKYDRQVLVCHVLRYTPFYAKLKEIVDSKVIGDIITVNAEENVGYWHQAHSYVRGNWRNTAESSPMIMSKSCHDLDILLWLIDDVCTQVSSYGHLTHFRKENAPEGAPERCLDGCPHRNECPYYAPHIYIEWKDAWQADVIRKVVSLDTSPAGLTKALKTGPYGRCVYRCDNDVVDHQVVNLDFAKGATASFTMTAFANDEGRVIKVMGTKGEIIGVADENIIKYVTYLDQTRHTIKVHPSGGHMGGDSGIMQDFARMLRENTADSGRTSAEKSVASHLLALAAEKSRVEGRNIRMDEYEKSLL